MWSPLLPHKDSAVTTATVKFRKMIDTVKPVSLHPHANMLHVSRIN